MKDVINPELVSDYLKNLQKIICQKFEYEDTKKFKTDNWKRTEGGGGYSCILEQGQIFEKAGVNFSHILGKQLPVSAITTRPELSGCAFEAMGISIVVHPRNPHVPTSHANLRFFVAEIPGKSPVWWFGGGFDLTPYYGYDEDAIHWHKTAKTACDSFGKDIYPHYKDWCDRYFYLKHRNEARGIGGLFFDDLNKPDFTKSFALVKSIGDHYLPAYLPIVKRRKDSLYSEKEREFQLYRRGRYVEFNLVYDRGTLFGLQSQGRTESILISLPPLVRWDYNREPEKNSPEERLYNYYLKPRNWLSD